MIFVESDEVAGPAIADWGITEAKPEISIVKVLSCDCILTKKVIKYTSLADSGRPV